ncbi:MAG: RdgB/HAM1 family non-canonical purine NTP pyrophosphatase [Candidatus Acidulodesulfobacterium ferriphilum]|jgi:XTP/dITP diphosphohydrolase|uniref:dITP/XTP pyrophosphatase n=1 Tax=Candidatus Acidulodesulfobacterium ferriphilum TaxID=2597223 RepID=A0A519BD67_9DELT|nr:MAG: RdgB/HAM1 family non-canonical purine NTP pyrophosphatase [Candidatus Acidulodesulfobacterium ferriphilum]
MINILIATGNTHKFQEIKSIMGNFAGRNIIFLDKSFQVDVIENGKTYKENAKIKVEGYVKFLNENPELDSEMSLDYIAGEDSGLEVECLGGAPGLFTARYAGENASDIENINKLLDTMRAKKDCVENRRAKFVCLACLYDIKRRSFRYFEGELKGSISNKISGTKGFGYDPVFFVPEFNKTVAQVDSSEKNKISHRAIAFKQVAEAIKER